MTETGEISPADAAVAIFKARLVAASPLVDEALDLADELVDEVRRLRIELADAERVREDYEDERDEANTRAAHLGIELERTEGDLGVAIREAAAAREALKEVWRIQAKYGPWGARDKIELAVSAALDQRLTQ